MRSKNLEIIDQFGILRLALLRYIAMFFIFFLILIYWKDEVLAFFLFPLSFLFIEHQLIITDITASFWVPLQCVLYMSFFLSIPVLLYQVWWFLSPALYPLERLFLQVALCASGLFIFLGASFCYLIAFPAIVYFLLSQTPVMLSMMPDVSMLFGLYIPLIFLFSGAFQLPLFLVVLSRWQWVTYEQLQDFRSYAIVSCFILGAVLTPPDVLSQCLLAIPLCFLYELGVWGVYFWGKPISDNRID